MFQDQKKNILATAIAMCLPLAGEAADFTVTVSSDDGTGDVSGTLSHAIALANSTSGNDSITLNTNVSVDGVMTRLIDSNITIQNDGQPREINGNGNYRALFIKSGTVTINDITIAGGKAVGGSAANGAPGAGMGGGIFIYDGDVTLNSVTITDSVANGGAQDLANYEMGGGGMGGAAGYLGGGGLFAAGNNYDGGYGGTGNYQNPVGFGYGGTTDFYNGNTQAGFGGGGAFPSGNGGFGGGGATPNGDMTAGLGGFGGGGVYAGSYGSNSSEPGFGGAYGQGAGMGGAVFIRTGNLTINNSTFNNNQANSTNNALGLGGAIFILHSNANVNGNNQGMPSELAQVSGCGNSFNGNLASGDAGVGNNNNNLFDLGSRVEGPALNAACPVEQELIVTVAEDDGTGLVENTLSWAIKEANSILGDDRITLATNVTITNVMKRLVDSNVTIQSDATRRSIDGDGDYRPLFIRSGKVTISELDVINGKAQGGNGFAGGAGMGGSLFVFSGDVLIDYVSFVNSQAIGGNSTLSADGGGGMFGDASYGGGGLFADANEQNGGDGGYYGSFGQGGSAFEVNGKFGGGGSFGLVSSGGNGGFGGAGGDTGSLFDDPGLGGFGGGAEKNPGYAANASNGAGMGGAVFIRSGQVEIRNTSFADGNASATGSAKGLGGAIFVVHSTSNPNGNNQGMPSTLATVTSCELLFNNNQATDDDNVSNNNNNVFDLGGRISDVGECPIFKNGFE